MRRSLRLCLILLCGVPLALVVASEENGSSGKWRTVGPCSQGERRDPLPEQALAISGNVPGVPDFALTVGKYGEILIRAGSDRYRFETRLSFPGEKIGWNRLGLPEGGNAGGDFIGGDRNWHPEAAGNKEGVIICRASGIFYSLERKVHFENGRVVCSDTIRNIRDEDLGIFYELDLIPAAGLQGLLLAGAEKKEARLTAENPSVFVRQARSGLGWIAEDSLLRLQLEMEAAGSSVRMKARHFALRPGKSHTFRWAFYILPAEADYWTFVNRVRRDWDVNFTVEGPFDFISVTERMDLIRDPDKLRSYLGRKRLKVIGLNPWVDYDNFNVATGRPMERHELKLLLQEAARALKRVDPEILCLGCMEGNLVTPPAVVHEALVRSSPGRRQGVYPLSREQMAALASADLRWKDCLILSRDGNSRYEIYYRGLKGGPLYPMIALAVYASPGNSQHLYWLDQARFFLEDVGLDGVYIDQFNMAFNDDQRYSFGAWDGTTVDIDPGTGKIIKNYTDAALVGIGARKSLVEYVLKNGRYMLANTFPESAEMQALRMHRFNESEWGLDPFTWSDGEMPPLSDYPCKGHFSTPVALGFRPSRYGEKGETDYAKVIMKGAIAYLRHGLLYYHYVTEIPEEGPGAGDYGPINHMFPTTVEEIHPGWVIGKERVVTCVSGSFARQGGREPRVLVFDLYGRPTKPQCSIRKEAGCWKVSLTLRDWAEIAVIESIR